MAGSARVHELAKELGVSSRDVLAKLNELGEFVKSASSLVAPPVAQRLREAFPPSRATVARLSPTPRVSSTESAAGEAIEHRVENMARWSDVVDVIRACRRATREHKTLVVDLRDVQSVWPNGCVPIAAVLQHYKAIGLPIAVRNETYFLQSASFRNPMEATTDNLQRHRLPNTVWVYFDEQEAAGLTNALVDVIERTVELADGVLEALNFCLFEVLDNVFQHSESGSGYLMATLTNQATRLALAVGDTGIGVFNSFKGSKYHPPSHFDALTLAIQAGITSTGDTRGNGLFGLKGTVEQNRGRLVLHSGLGTLSIIGDNVTGRDYVSAPPVDRDNYGFFLDWQLDLKQPVSLHDVLGMPVVNTRLEAVENEVGDYVVRISEHDAGTGTRKAAEQLRLYLLNLLHAGAPSLTLDFEGARVVSASFADEVIGKLAAAYGPLGFFRTFRLQNMSTTIESLLDRAIRLRIGAESPPAISRGTAR